MQVLCRLKGSVVPKALIWSVPCAGLTLGNSMAASCSITTDCSLVVRDDFMGTCLILRSLVRLFRCFLFFFFGGGGGGGE